MIFPIRYEIFYNHTVRYLTIVPDQTSRFLSKNTTFTASICPLMLLSVPKLGRKLSSESDFPINQLNCRKLLRKHFGELCLPLPKLFLRSSVLNSGFYTEMLGLHWNGNSFIIAKCRSYNEFRKV